jgi:hypothetical protein
MLVDLFGLMNLVDISIISAALGVLAGVINSVFASRRAEKQRQTEIETRQAQLFMQLMDKCSSKEGIENFRVLDRATWSSYEEWLELRRDDIEYDTAYRWISGIYNGTGALLREGLLNVRIIALVATRAILSHWEKHKDVIHNLRERRNDRSYRVEWEYLYNTIMKYLDEHPELAP